MPYIDKTERLRRKKKIFRKLDRLFKSGPIVKHTLQATRKAKTGGVTGMGSTARADMFRSGGSGFIGYGQHHQSLSFPAGIWNNYDRYRRIYDYQLMDQDPIISCIIGDTKVATLEGFISIKDLCKKYSKGEKFEVWAWDSNNNQYTIGQAHYPRKTGVKEIIEIVIDNGKIFKCTPDHRIMLIDGTYKMAGDLKQGDSLMPFNYRNNKHHKYIELKKPNGKFKFVHRYIYEDVFNKNIGSKNIHHINHIKSDNRTSNLICMSPEDHMALHGISCFTNKKRSDASKKLWLNSDYRERALVGLKKWQNSSEGREFMSKHASHLNKERWKNDVEYAKKMACIFSNHAKSLWLDQEWSIWKRKQHSETIRKKYANDPSYKDRTKHVGSSNGRFAKEITNERILLEGLKYKTISDFVYNFDFGSRQYKNERQKKQFVRRRLKTCGYRNWKEYKENHQYSNHKVVGINRNKEVTDVYDLTVDHFENFCLENGLIISNSALDIYADESTTIHEDNHIVQISAPTPRVKKILEELYYEILNVEFWLWAWVRNFCKYGDFFEKIVVQEEVGVVEVQPIPINGIERLEERQEDGSIKVDFRVEVENDSYSPWQIAHFRLIGDDTFLPYGKSCIEAARRPWRQLEMLEDAMLVYRVTRAAERRVFYVEVGNVEANTVESYINRMRDQFKRVPVVDRSQGSFELRYNPASADEDFFIPVRDGEGSRIDTLPGAQNLGDIEDVEYVQKKLFAALKIPKSFLTYEEDVSAKATLSQEDIRFARTIQRIQKIFLAELAKIGLVHLIMLGYDSAEALGFELSLNNPSTIAEIQKLELLDQKLEVAQKAAISYFPRSWVYKNIFGVPVGRLEEIEKEMVADKLLEFKMNKMAEEGPAALKEALTKTPSEIDQQMAQQDQQDYEEPIDLPQERRDSWRQPGRPNEYPKTGAVKQDWAMGMADPVDFKSLVKVSDVYKQDNVQNIIGEFTGKILKRTNESEEVRKSNSN